MLKQTPDDKEISVTNAYSLFVYAIRIQITRDYYLRRLRTFFDYIKVLPNANIEQRCNRFAAKAAKDHNWTFGTIISFLLAISKAGNLLKSSMLSLYGFIFSKFRKSFSLSIS